MIKPAMMGALMGLMMVWTLHGALTGGGVSGWALAAFVTAHVAVAAVLVGAAVFASRLSPRLRAWIARLHRPSFRHAGAMLGCAACTFGTLHLFAHGFGGL